MQSICRVPLRPLMDRHGYISGLSVRGRKITRFKHVFSTHLLHFVYHDKILFFRRLSVFTCVIYIITHVNTEKLNL